jgi:hypothetical protein
MLVGLPSTLLSLQRVGTTGTEIEYPGVFSWTIRILLNLFNTLMLTLQLRHIGCLVCVYPTPILYRPVMPVCVDLYACRALKVWSLSAKRGYSKLQFKFWREREVGLITKRHFRYLLRTVICNYSGWRVRVLVADAPSTSPQKVCSSTSRGSESIGWMVDWRRMGLRAIWCEGVNRIQVGQDETR